MAKKKDTPEMTIDLFAALDSAPAPEEDADQTDEQVRDDTTPQTEANEPAAQVITDGAAPTEVQTAAPSVIT